MKRVSMIMQQVHNNLEEKCYGYQKQEGYQHLYSVSILCTQLALKRNINAELASIIGILHDYATYYTGTSFDHANRSAMLSQELLEKSKIFTKEEIDSITTAIKYHSQKDKVHDVYSELIKDADILYYYLQEPDIVLSKEKEVRLNKLKTEL